MAVSEFSDVFVSYRRKNVDFAKKVVDALRAKDKEVWVDWEDIPPGSVGFTGDIEKGIEGADSFVCILSPDYMESEYCLMELDHAVKMNKKLVPIVLKKFDGYDVPSGIGHINWVYFTPHAGQENTFEESFPKVMDAIDTDLEHVRYHKRLLIRAIEWQKNDKKNGFLLMDDELDEAQQWVVDDAAIEPHPTELQMQYIDASRHLKDRRQRMMLTGVTVALGVSVVLTIIAINMFFAAQTARFNTNVRLLANQLPAISANDPFVARSIAYEMLDLGDIPLVAEAAAQNNLLTSAAIDTFMDHEDIVSDVELIGAGEQFITASGDGNLRLFNANSRSVARVFYDARNESGVRSVSLAPDQTHLLSGAQDGTVLYWDIQSETAISVFNGHEADLYAVRILADGQRAITGDEDGVLLMWDIATGEIITEFDGHEGGILDIEITPDMQFMITGTDEGDVVLWDVESGEILEIMSGHSGEIYGVDISKDATLVVSGSADNTIMVWQLDHTLEIHEIDAEDDEDDTETDQETDASGDSENEGDDANKENTLDSVLVVTATRIDTLRGHRDEVWDVMFDYAETDVISIAGDRTVRIWELGSVNPPRVLTGHSGWGNALSITPDNRYIVSGADDNAAILWDLDRSSLIAEYQPDSTSRARVLSSAISPDGTLLAVGLDTGAVTFIDTATMMQSDPYHESASRVESMAFMPDGTLLTGHCADPTEFPCTMGEVIRWDTNQRSVIASYLVEVGLVSSIATGTNDTIGDFFVAAGTGFEDDAGNDLYEAILLDSGGTELGRFVGHTLGIDGLSVSADGTQLLTASRDVTLKLWSINDQSPIRTFSEHNDWVSDVEFFSDGQTAISTSWDGTLIQWDLETGTVIRQFEGHQGAVMEVAIAPNGETVISGSRDSSVFLWDLDNGEAVRILDGHGDDVISLSWVNDGTRAYSGSFDGTVRYWQVFLNDDLQADELVDARSLVDLCDWDANSDVPLAYEYNVPQLCGNFFDRTIDRYFN